MESSYQFESSAHWTGGRQGVVQCQGVEPSIQFSAPPEFQGIPGVWNPEHFFTSAIATCFITTFQAIASFSKFGFAGLEVYVEGTVEKVEGGFKFTQVTVRPKLTVANEADRERGRRLLEKSEKACLISRSLQSEIILEPDVQIAAVAAQI